MWKGFFLIASTHKSKRKSEETNSNLSFWVRKCPLPDVRKCRITRSGISKYGGKIWRMVSIGPLRDGKRKEKLSQFLGKKWSPVDKGQSPLICCSMTPFHFKLSFFLSPSPPFQWRAHAKKEPPLSPPNFVTVILRNRACKTDCLERYLKSSFIVGRTNGRVWGLFMIWNQGRKLDFSRTLNITTYINSLFLLITSNTNSPHSPSQS